MITVIQDGSELIAAGQFMTLGNGEVQLILRHELEEIKVVFLILEDENKKSNLLEGKVTKNDTLQITLTNFWNKIGTPVGPQLLGTISNRQLYMVLCITGMSPAQSKQISYSFYLGGNGNA